MLANIKNDLKKNPTMYYAMSIVASWAGVGSLMNFRTLANQSGMVSAIIWGVFNCLACIIFGIVIDKVPKMKDVMETKAMFYFISFLTIFQTWTQMSGISEIFGDTPIGTTGGTIIAYAAGIIFIIILLKSGMIRNVLTDSASWILVYVLLVVVVICSLIYTHGEFNEISVGATSEGVKAGLTKGFLLLPGPFTYPYYYEIFNHCKENEDGIEPSNAKQAFILAGIMFTIYMVFAAALTWVKFSPTLNIIKAVLIATIAISSISTYLYSEYIAFGRKWGLIINVITVGGWFLFIPMGVMGIWTLMSKIRLPFILGALIVAIVLTIREKRKNEVPK